MAERFTDTLGVSSIVRIVRTDSIADGDIGMVFEQRPAGAHRYGVLFPGCPLPIWYRAEDLEVMQGVDLEGWWRRA
jgi:hypothetical protein